MRSPLAAWRAGVRWPLGLLGLLAALIVVVGVCEALGWPFLVEPVQNALAKALDRKVAFGKSDERGVRIGLLGSVRVRAASIDIGAPAWSQAPHMLAVENAYLRLGYLDLWRAWRGGPLHIAALEAATLDAVIERQADGRASWEFGQKPSPQAGDTPATLPTFGELEVGRGQVAYRDALMPAQVDARFSLKDSSSQAASPAASSAGFVIAAGGAASAASGSSGFAPMPAMTDTPVASGLRLNATGSYRKLPLRIDLATSGVLGMLGPDAAAQPIALTAAIGRAELAFNGSTTDPLHFRALKGGFTLAGPSLAAVGDPLGITLPTTPAFATRGTLAKDGGVYKAVFDSAQIGSSRLEGAFTYDKRPKVPLLSGRLGGSRLVLADLGPAVGAPAVEGGDAKADAVAAARASRVIPDKKFDLPSLRAMDANVLIEIAMFDPGTTIIEPLRPARAHLLLADGVLTLTDFEGSTAQGKLVGYLQLDGRGDKALWTADLRLLGISLAQWLKLKRSGSAPPYVSGKLDAQVKVKGSGRSTAEILASLDGDIRAHLREASVSHLIVELGGIDIAQGLGMVFKGDDALPILCNVADLDVVKGVIKPKVFVINTNDSTIWIDGTISLRDEGMDLRAIVSPKDFSPLTLRTPIHVRGTLGKPAVSLELGKMAAKAGAAGLLALLNPLAAVIPFIDPGAKADAKKAGEECARLVPSSGKIAAPVRVPGSTRVPPAPLPPSSAPARR